jgi:hypothetical protein
MSKRLTWMIPLLLAVAAFTPATAKEGKFFSAHLNYVLSEIEGEGRTIDDLVGTRFDLEDDLGLDEEDEFPELQLWFHFLRRHSLGVSYFRSSYDGKATLDDTLIIHDETFPAGTTVESEVDFDLARLHYNFRFLDFKVVDLGLVVGVDLYSGEGSISDAAGILPDADGDFDAPFPVLGLNATVKIPGTGLFLHGEVSGANFDLDDVDADVLDAQARLTWYILQGPVGLSIGYRHLDLDLEVEDEGTLDITQEGFYGGIAVRF